MTDDDSPTKTVTIRGVDKTLYEKFSTLSSHLAPTIGAAFTIIAKTFTKEQAPDILQGRIRRIIHIATHKQRSGRIERIANLDRLVISKKDLIDAGEASWVFVNIKNLVFDETVDNKLFLKYVHRIKNCNINVEGRVSRLFLESAREPKFKLSGDFTNVTIRNVDARVYDEFVIHCNEMDITIGEGVNNLLQSFLPSFELHNLIMKLPTYHDGNTINVSCRDAIDVTEDDLIELEDRKVLFHRIENISFKGVPKALFIEKVVAVIYCDNVILPEDLPKLIAHSRVISSQ